MQAEYICNKVAGQMDAHLIESIISLFNSGVLSHYIRTPRISVNPENYNMDVSAANGVKFEGREKIIKLQQQLADAEKRYEFIKYYALERWVGADLWNELEKEYKEKYSKNDN
jgi:hypothetical protein